MLIVAMARPYAGQRPRVKVSRAARRVDLDRVEFLEREEREDAGVVDRDTVEQ
jgi:hypothetical protein